MFKWLRIIRSKFRLHNFKVSLILVESQLVSPEQHTTFRLFLPGLTGLASQVKNCQVTG